MRSSSIAGDMVGGRTRGGRVVRKREQFADRIQREAQFAGMADEGQPVAMALAIDPLIAGGARRCRQQADLFVIADGLDLGAGLARQGSDGKGRGPAAGHAGSPVGIAVRHVGCDRLAKKGLKLQSL
jgi:hypothetical protein